MSAVHWKQGIEILQRLVAEPRFGFFSDLDGTLAPIAPTPDAAHLSPRAHQLLSDLRDAVPVVGLISGRRAESLQAKVGIEGLIYIGNHGLEQWVDGRTEILPEAKPYLPAIHDVGTALKPLEIPGVYVEDKEATLSLHYRQAVNPDAFADANAGKIAEIIDRTGLSLFSGKMVFEVRPPIHVDKGVALRKLITEHKLNSAVFIGDDFSDLSALDAVRKMRANDVCDAWGVGVQSSEAPEALADSADLLADDVPDVEELLSWILSARKASST